MSVLGELKGVGPKVASCVALYGLGWTEVVPLDVHMIRIARNVFGMGDKSSRRGKDKGVSNEERLVIQSKFIDMFGDLAGWAQALLFTNDIDKVTVVKREKGDDDNNNNNDEGVIDKKRRKK